MVNLCTSWCQLIDQSFTWRYESCYAIIGAENSHQLIDEIPGKQGLEKSFQNSQVLRVIIQQEQELWEERMLLAGALFPEESRQMYHMGRGVPRWEGEVPPHHWSLQWHVLHWGKTARGCTRELLTLTTIFHPTSLFLTTTTPTIESSIRGIHLRSQRKSLSMILRSRLWKVGWNSEMEIGVRCLLGTVRRLGQSNFAATHIHPPLLPPPCISSSTQALLHLRQNASACAFQEEISQRETKTHVAIKGMFETKKDVGVE